MIDPAVIRKGDLLYVGFAGRYRVEGVSLSDDGIRMFRLSNERQAVASVFGRTYLVRTEGWIRDAVTSVQVSWL